jgi:hypothetical protein
MVNPSLSLKKNLVLKEIENFRQNERNKQIQKKVKEREDRALKTRNLSKEDATLKNIKKIIKGIF